MTKRMLALLASPFWNAFQLNRATNQIVPHSHVGVQADVIQVDMATG
jgi:hypothetical protein